MIKTISLRIGFFYILFHICKSWFLNPCQINLIKYTFISLISYSTVFFWFLKWISMWYTFWIVILVLVLIWSHIHQTFSLIFIDFNINSFLFVLFLSFFKFDFLLNIFQLFLRLRLRLYNILWFYWHVLILLLYDLIWRNDNFFIRIIFVFNYDLFIFLTSREHELSSLLLLFCELSTTTSFFKLFNSICISKSIQSILAWSWSWRYVSNH